MPRRTKDAAIVLLVLVNVVLLCAVLTYVVNLPKAHAQAIPDQATDSGPYLAVAGQVQTGSDVQYVLDVGLQRLYVFTPTRLTGNTVTMQMTDWRDLRTDFAKQSAPTVPRRTR